MSKLAVFLHEQRVGELEQDESGLLRFAYLPDWLARVDATPLSRMLPLAPTTYENRLVRPFFAGILPDEEPRKRIADILGISERNDFAMLERIGGECAGAVSLLPEGSQPLPLEHRLRELNQEELEAVIAELPNRPLLAGEHGMRLSLAGARDKLPVVVEGDSILLPLGNTPSTHIIKPEPDRFPGLAANEVLCMRLAAAVGLNVPPVTHRRIGNRACIVVARYDRAQSAGGKTTVRLHQEDFCQALGRPPERKYQEEGGPTVRECVALLREWSTTPVLDLRAFVDALILNLLIGNTDAHGKNYSMVYRGGEKRLAPLYDLVATIAWPGITARLAMSIGNGKQVNDLNPAHFKGMAEQTNLGWPMIRDRIGSLSGKVIEVLKDGRLFQDSPDPAYVASLSDRIAERCKRLQ